MNWLLFLVVIGPQGPIISNDGRPIATAIDRVHCDALGGALAALMNHQNAGAAFRFNYHCVEARGA